MSNFENIEEFIPHRAPMIMLDKVLSIEDFEVKTSYIIKEDCILAENEQLQETGLIENMAQTSFIFLKALFADETNIDFQDQDKTLGFISTIKNLKILALPKVGQELITTTQVALVFTSPTMKIIDVKGYTQVNNTTLFESEMKMLVQTQAE